MSQTSIDQQILHLILTNLVTEPAEVKIERIIDEQGVLFHVLVSSKDMGIVIGRNGSMASSIKTIMRAVGKANKMNIRVHFLEPDGSVKYVASSNSNKFQPVSKPAGELTKEGENKESIATADSILSLEDDLKDFVVN